MTSFSKMTDGKLQEMWFFVILLSFEQLTTWNYYSEIYYWSQMKINMNRGVAQCVQSNQKGCFFLVGVHPRVQKRWMTLGSHPWVRWIGLTGALHDLTHPLNPTEDSPASQHCLATVNNAGDGRLFAS